MVIWTHDPVIEPDPDTLDPIAVDEDSPVHDDP
jgi:hypothetical protein